MVGRGLAWVAVLCQKKQPAPASTAPVAPAGARRLAPAILLHNILSHTFAALILAVCPPADEDWGIKFNYSAGEPAPEKITDKIFGFTESISELKVGWLLMCEG